MALVVSDMRQSLSLLEEIEDLLFKKAADEQEVPSDINTILAATEKVLAVNRGEAEPDERDSLQFRRILTPAEQYAERISMDAGKVRRIAVRRAAKMRSLKPIGVGAFDAYTDSLFNGNPLCLPLEEINTNSLIEQARRISAMGLGGLSSDDSISSEATALHPSTFGFLSSIEGPECHSGDTEVFTKSGWKFWPQVRSTDLLACKTESNELFFAQPERLIAEPYVGAMVCADARMFHFCVTPNHRLLVSNHDRYRTTGINDWKSISAVDYSQHSAVRFDTGHKPYAGGKIEYWQLPYVASGSHTQKSFGHIDIELWSEFMGWYLSAGNVYTGLSKKTGCRSYVTYISQSSTANTELLSKLPFSWSYSQQRFLIPGKPLALYLKQFGFALDKFIPEYLFEAPAPARSKLLQALLLGDGRMNAKHMNFTSGSKRLAEDFERLAIGLGCVTNFRKYFDNRDRVKDCRYEVSILRSRERVVARRKRTGVGGVFSTISYDGMVYCATVPGSMLLTRRGASTGIWTGNSARAGVDTRLAWGAKIGSDGKIYRKMKHAPSGKDKWVSAPDLHNSVVGLPD